MHNTKAIKALNARYHEEIQAYKDFAEKRRKRRKWTQEKVLQFHESLCRYMEERGDEPLTISGAILATGVDRNTWYRMRDGEFDYLLYEYCDKNNIDVDEEEGVIYCGTDGQDVLLVPYSDIIKKYLLILQDQIERNIYTNKGNPAGSIFALKALYGWKDTPTGQTVTSDTLIRIATREQAEAAIKLLQD